jgi:biotin---protein ligase
MVAHVSSELLKGKGYLLKDLRDQIVTIESEGGLRARIKGITRDWGLLLAEELAYGDRETGHMITLQSDSNSFDFFKGLIKKKI